MRILSQNVLLHGRRGLKGLGLVGVGVACGSCAKFPANSASNFTAITVSITVAGNINPNYVYDVAFAPYDITSPLPQYAPVLVVNNGNNPNGRMAGSPTAFVEFPSQAGYTSAYPFQLYQFALSSQIPNPSDPNNPVNLAVYSPSNLGQITNFTTPWNGGTDPSTISFTIYTNELTATDGSTGQALQSMQMNVLTMTRVANLGSGARVYDALGPTNTAAGLTDFLQVNLLQSAPYNNANNFEIPGDTLGGTDPDVDIINYSVTISHP